MTVTASYVAGSDFAGPADSAVSFAANTIGGIVRDHVLSVSAQVGSGTGFTLQAQVTAIDEAGHATVEATAAAATGLPFEFGEISPLRTANFARLVDLSFTAESLLLPYHAWDEIAGTQALGVVPLAYSGGVITIGTAHQLWSAAVDQQLTIDAAMIGATAAGLWAITTPDTGPILQLVSATGHDAAYMPAPATITDLVATDLFAVGYDGVNADFYVIGFGLGYAGPYHSPAFSTPNRMLTSQGQDAVLFLDGSTAVRFTAALDTASRTVATAASSVSPSSSGVDSNTGNGFPQPGTGWQQLALAGGIYITNDDANVGL